MINHTIPDDDKAYLHRAGRTGRAGKTGIAVTFVDWDDLHKWALINRALEFGQPEPVETYSSSPAPVLRPRHPGGHEGPAEARPHGRADALEHRGPQRGARRGRRRARAAFAVASPHPRRPARRRVGRGRRDRRLGRRRAKEPGTGTHDGKGHEHHDGKAAPPRVAAVAAAPARPEAPHPRRESARGIRRSAACDGGRADAVHRRRRSRVRARTYGVTGADPRPSAMMRSTTSGAVRHSPSRFGLPAPW